MVAAGSIIRDGGNKIKKTHCFCNVYSYNILVCSVNKKYVKQRCVEEPNVKVCVVMYFIKKSKAYYFIRRKTENFYFHFMSLSFF